MGLSKLILWIFMMTPLINSTLFVLHIKLIVVSVQLHCIYFYVTT